MELVFGALLGLVMIGTLVVEVVVEEENAKYKVLRSS